MSTRMTRREFITRSGTFAASVSALQFLRPGTLQSFPVGSRPRILLFHDTSFPTIDAEPCDHDALLRAFAGTPLEVADAGRLAAACRAGAFDILVTAHGSAFPEEAGDALFACLASGTHWLQLGGVPLAVPVQKRRDGWHAGIRRTRWHRRLGITQSFPVDCSGGGEWTDATGTAELAGHAGDLEDARVHALYWRLTSSSYFPEQEGSPGPRDAILRPLIYRRREDGTPTAAAVQCVDWMQGEFAGGRWVIATGDRIPGGALLSLLADIAACGAAELVVSPGVARYRWEEAPSMHVRLHRPRREGSTACTVEVLAGEEVIARHEGPLRWTTRTQAELSWQLGAEETVKLRAAAAAASGTPHARLFTVRAQCQLPCAGGVSGLHARSGFWMAGDGDFARGPRVGTDGSALTVDGDAIVVAGTSYMAGDVHRNFLLTPNPWNWKEDMDAMRATGITMLRTGFWFGWKRMMLEPGSVDRGVLRAMDAFVLTAQEAGLPFIFSFFAFLPESWGGENPFLDPRAVDAQCAFVTAFARRYREAPGIIWDLINEPSFSSPSQIWRCRPNYDRHEAAAWARWLRERFPAEDDDAFRKLLRERWRGTMAEDFSLPALEDFEDGNLFSDRRPLKALDYRLFAQDAFAGWVRTLSRAIRDVDDARRLVMVGQDEGGTLDRPSPQFFADAVDITSVHSWWFNDDLIWDSVVTRPAGKPHLVQETGAMFYENATGSAWRSEEESAALVARKLVIAAGTGSAGFVHWLWNTNPYMYSDNEAAIGALRCDGSAKPEFDVLRRMARFLERSRSSLRGRREEDAVLVLPHADQFSVRGNATRATRASVRCLLYRFRVPMRAVSEYALARDQATAQLYIVPSAAVLTESAWNTLLEKADAGATVLITGVLDRDDAWRPVPRSALFGLTTRTVPVSQAELLRIGGRTWTCGYRGEDMQRIEKAALPGMAAAGLHKVLRGKGQVLWCPLPVELSDAEDALTMLYRKALPSRMEMRTIVEPNLPGVLVYPSHYRGATTVAVVSELSTDTKLRVRCDRDIDFSLALPAGRGALLLFDERGHELSRVTL